MAAVCDRVQTGFDLCCLQRNHPAERDVLVTDPLKDLNGVRIRGRAPTLRYAKRLELSLNRTTSAQELRGQFERKFLAVCPLLRSLPQWTHDAGGIWDVAEDHVIDGYAVVEAALFVEL